MQGWHAQRLLGFGEVTEPIIKVSRNETLSVAPGFCFNLYIIDGIPSSYCYILMLYGQEKNLHSSGKREKHLKSIGMVPL